MESDFLRKSDLFPKATCGHGHTHDCTCLINSFEELNMLDPYPTWVENEGSNFKKSISKTKVDKRQVMKYSNISDANLEESVYDEEKID